MVHSSLNTNLLFTKWKMREKKKVGETERERRIMSLTLNQKLEMINPSEKGMSKAEIS